MINFNRIKFIAFDADDTLWGNEGYFREAEEKLCALLSNYIPDHAVSKELYLTETRNVPKYGYGVKSFMLSMIETAVTITDNTLKPAHIKRCIEIGSELLERPVVLLPGVEDVLRTLKGRYTLVLATKGDLLDQERKLVASGLSNYFHHIEIMTDKTEREYLKLLKRLDCQAEDLLMIGNSLKSDVLPVLELGGSAIHVPYHLTWHHEHVDIEMDHPRFLECNDLGKVLLAIRNTGTD